MSDKAIIQIFRGDDTDAIGCENIVGTITTDLNISGCTVTFQYLGFTQNFTGLSSGDTFTVVIPHAVTKTFPPGLGYASVKVIDASGKIRTFNNRIPVFVRTSTPFDGDGSSFDVTFNENDNYEALNNKPQINGVELIGNKSSSELGLQSEITDIGTIRSGANKGASSVQTVNHTAPDASGNVNVDTVTDYSALTNKPAIDGVELTKDSTAAGLGLAKTSDLATVATSGSYDDLTNKPTIPAAVTVDSALSSTSTNPVQNKVVMGALYERRDKTDLVVYQRWFSCVNTSGVTLARVYFATSAGGLPERVVIYDDTGTTILTDVTMEEIRTGASGWTVNEQGTEWQYNVYRDPATYGTVSILSVENSETFSYYSPFGFNGYILSVGRLDFHPTAYNGTIVNEGLDALAQKSEVPPAQVQSDWNETDTTSKAYIQNKPTIPAEVTVDSALSATSTNPVQNKVVKGALDAKQDTISDLSTIRSGAAKGVTSVQTVNNTAPDANGNVNVPGGSIDPSVLNAKLDATSAAPAYDATATYAVGATVSYNGGLYRCTNATVAGTLPTDTDYWTAEILANRGYLSTDGNGNVFAVIP